MASRVGRAFKRMENRKNMSEADRIKERKIQLKWVKKNPEKVKKIREKAKKIKIELIKLSKEIGNCSYCFKPKDNPLYLMCFSCRKKKREERLNINMKKKCSPKKDEKPLIVNGKPIHEFVKGLIKRDIKFLKKTFTRRGEK